MGSRAEDVEHLVTLFDSGFLPQALALHASLRDKGEPFKLWAICMDELACTALDKLGYDDFISIRLAEVEAEHPELLTIKSSRARGEYCWTLTPFSYSAVFARCREAKRVTYVDADICFFGPISCVLREMDESDADVLLTEHAYAPEYAIEETNGRFCVQFLPIKSSNVGNEIIAWWQARCIEWCYARCEDGKFGDQKYLDDWLIRWPQHVVVLKNVFLTLAPWNVNELARRADMRGIYHFHGLRIYKHGLVRLWSGYRISRACKKEFYDPYLSKVANAIECLNDISISAPKSSLMIGVVALVKMCGRLFVKRNELWILR